jgi:hypothetical protein
MPLPKMQVRSPSPASLRGEESDIVVVRHSVRDISVADALAYYCDPRLLNGNAFADRLLSEKVRGKRHNLIPLQCCALPFGGPPGGCNNSDENDKPLLPRAVASSPFPKQISSFSTSSRLGVSGTFNGTNPVNRDDEIRKRGLKCGLSPVSQLAKWSTAGSLVVGPRFKN